MSLATPLERCESCGEDGGEVRATSDGKLLCSRCVGSYLRVVDAGVPNDATKAPWHLGTSPEDGFTEPESRVSSPGTAGTLRRLDVRDLLSREPEPVRWIAEGIVARGTLTLIAGREKEGKSMLCLGIAARVASGGGDLAGIDVQGGRALVVDGENGQREVHRRVRALGLHAGQATSLEVFEANGHDLRQHLAEVDAILAEHRPDLLVLDSWRSLWGGEENDAGEVARVLDPLRALVRRHDVACLLIHHLSRAGAYRGSTAIGASVEAVVSLERMPEDDDRRRRRLRVLACRYEQEADDRWLRIEADRSRGLLLIDAADPFRPTAGAREAAADALLARLPAEPTTWPVWVRSAGFEPKDGTARRAREQLLEQGEVLEVQGLYVRKGWTPTPRNQAPA